MPKTPLSLRLERSGLYVLCNTNGSAPSKEDWSFKSCCAKSGSPIGKNISSKPFTCTYYTQQGKQASRNKAQIKMSEYCILSNVYLLLIQRPERFDVLEKNVDKRDVLNRKLEIVLM